MPVRVLICLMVLWAAIALPVRGQYQVQSAAPPSTIAPATAKVTEITIENPSSAASKCYLDLDAGKTFARSDNPLELGQSQRWMSDNGIDLKCDTAFPVEGMAVYDLMFVPADGAFDSYSDHDGLLARFKGQADPLSMDLKRVPEKLPATYLFKTGGGAVGVMEIRERTEGPNGLKLRFKIIPKPEAVLARGGRRGGVNRGAVAFQGVAGVNIGAGQAAVPGLPGAATFEFRGSVPANGRGFVAASPAPGTVAAEEDRLIQTQQQNYERLRQTLGDNHPEVIAARKRVELYQQLRTSRDAPIQTDAVLADLNRRKRDLELTRARLDEQLRQIQSSIESLEKDRRAQAARAPTTMRAR